MCGIFGILNGHNVAMDIADGLSRLEYRGYDSAGIATLTNGEISLLRTGGKVECLKEELENNPLIGKTGIGHTRWATHGAPIPKNAHPHVAQSVAVVHNGIIENYKELKQELINHGHSFKSDTDSEVVPQLVSYFLECGLKPIEATMATLSKLQGTYALAIMFKDREDLMIAARKGSPLAIGKMLHGACLSSDALALEPLTRSVMFLEDGDIAELTLEGTVVYDTYGNETKRDFNKLNKCVGGSEKDGFEHFTLKEIHQQPAVVKKIIKRLVDINGDINIESLPFDFTKLERLLIVACGTSYYSGLVARSWFEKIAKIPVDVEIASEFRYQERPYAKKTGVIVISQSGETADTLASLRHAKTLGFSTFGIVNVVQSSIAREADGFVDVGAGPEIGVASTKAFTAQMTVMALMALKAAHGKNEITSEQLNKHICSLYQIPIKMIDVLDGENRIKQLAKTLEGSTRALFIGRGVHWAVAMEGALKLKEISYIHAEGFAAGELKHGPIALVEKGTPVIVLAPPDKVFDKTISNMEEVISRGANVIFLGNKTSSTHLDKRINPCPICEIDNPWTPFLYVLPLQLLAYHTALNLGTDVDRPRNLAKSVTVE